MIERDIAELKEEIRSLGHNPDTLIRVRRDIIELFKKNDIVPEAAAPILWLLLSNIYEGEIAIRGIKKEDVYDLIDRSAGELRRMIHDSM